MIVQNGFVEVTLIKQIPHKWNQLAHLQSGEYLSFIELTPLIIQMIKKR